MTSPNRFSFVSKSFFPQKGFWFIGVIAFLFLATQGADLIDFSQERSGGKAEDAAPETPEYILEFRGKIAELGCEDLRDIRKDFMADQEDTESNEEFDYYQTLIEETVDQIRKTCKRGGK